MLTHLAIHDFVLVRALDVEPGPGFTALTGETGAGKSVILGALAFALGGPARSDRARQDRIRPGADLASVAAAFDPPAQHPVRQLLAERGFDLAGGEPIVFRRTLRRGGASRAFLNDQPVGAALLAEAGGLLVEIHGQHESVGLMEPLRHRALLDSFGGCAALRAEVADAWSAWREAASARREMEAELARAGAERSFLEHALEELDALAPAEGECARLALDRAAMQAGERVAEAIAGAADALARAGVESALAAAARSVGRAQIQSGMGQPALEGEAAGSDIAARLHAAAEALDRALIEAGEARAALLAAQDACAFSPDALEASEVRLFALRAAARKHSVDPDALPGLRARLRARLDSLAHADAALAGAARAEAAAQAAWDAAAGRLSSRRAAAAGKLARAVAAELPPLHLARARFRVSLPARAEPGPNGREDVLFEIETQAGA
jgi:DNA repair protein RecN (Recombination protein N)